MLRKLAALHDAVTRAGFAGAVACVGAMAVGFCYEVGARYFFNAPTDWANPLVSYLLCAMIFLAMPEMTRQAAHVAITILIDRLKGRPARATLAAIRVVAAVACVLAAWFSLDATLGQYEQGIWTNPPFAVPKWALSALIPYGMLSAAVHFARQLSEPPVHDTLASQV